MDSCRACDASIFRIFHVPETEAEARQEQYANNNVPFRLRRKDSKLLLHAFKTEQTGFAPHHGLGDLPVEHADLELHNDDSAFRLAETSSAIYRYQQPNCFGIGIRSGIRGAVVGTAFGGAMALSTAVQSGYRGTAAASYAGMGAMRNAAAFGSWTGLYSFSQCSMARMRGRNDLLNPIVAGAFTGAALTLISTRGYWRYSQSTILANAAGSAMVATIFHALSYM